MTTTAPTAGVSENGFISNLGHTFGNVLGTALNYAVTPRWARTQVANQSYPQNYNPTYAGAYGPPPVPGMFRSPNDPWLRPNDTIGGTHSTWHNPDGSFGGINKNWLIVGGIAAGAIALLALTK